VKAPIELCVEVPQEFTGDASSTGRARGSNECPISAVLPDVPRVTVKGAQVRRESSCARE
jgi:hypothetical protein